MRDINRKSEDNQEDSTKRADGGILLASGPYENPDANLYQVIKKIIQENLTIEVEADSRYGSYDEDGFNGHVVVKLTWNGNVISESSATFSLK